MSLVPWRRGGFWGRVLITLETWRVWRVCPRTRGSVAGSGACPRSPGGVASLGGVSLVPWRRGGFVGCPRSPGGVAGLGGVSLVSQRRGWFGGRVLDPLKAW